MSPLSYIGVQGRLEAIERDLAERQLPFEEAAGDYHRMVRDFELRVARTMLQTRGETVTERRAKALAAVAAAADDLYEKLLEAEGRYEGLKAAVRVLETRATIGMSLLKTMTRDGSGVLA